MHRSTLQPTFNRNAGQCRICEAFGPQYQPRLYSPAKKVALLLRPDTPRCIERGEYVSICN